MAAGEPCLQYARDAAGDQATPSTPALDTTPADVLNVSMEWTDEGIILTGQLGGDPRTVDGFTYSYWIGFEDGGRSAGGNRPSWTWQRDSLYERISTMRWDSPEWYEVRWTNNAFSFLIPWSDFEKQYGVNNTGDIGSPSLSVSGPNPGDTGLNNPTQDRADYAFDLVPMGPCEDKMAMTTEQVSQGLPGEDQNAPAVSVWVLVLGLVVVGVLRRG